MHKSLITFLLLIAMGVNLKSQITLQIADVESCTSPVLVPIIIQEDITLISMQFTVQWEGTELGYAGTTAPIFPSGFAFGGPTGDTLTFSWFNFGGFTLNAGDTIFSLQFNLLGAPGDISTVEYYTGSDPAFPATEAAEPGFVPVPVTEVNGSVTYGGVNPVFENCPTDITIPNVSGTCQAVATWTAPTVMDCDNNANPPTSTANPGDSFPVGTTLVTYNVSDTDGNMGFCSFNVTVEDVEPPSINCSVPSITVNVPSGTTSTVVTDANLIPTFGDNCPGAVLSYVRVGATSDSGSGNANNLSYNVGTTTVTYTVTDAAMLTTTCSIDVIVVESAVDPITLQVVSQNVGCDASTTEVAIVVLEDVDVVSLQYSVYWNSMGLTYTGNTAPIFPSGFAFGQTADTLTFSWFDFNGFSLSAGDTIFSLQFNVNGTIGTCYPVNFYDGNNPLVGPIEAAGPGFIPIPINTINGEVCLEDLAPPVITCPNNVTIQCGESTLPTNTGMATAVDDCDPAPAVTFADVSVPGCGNTEVITRTFTATDAQMQSSTCTQTITIQDIVNPVFSSTPTPLADINCGDAFPVQETLTATDNCGTATVVPTQTFTVDDCNGYLVTYTWTATDDCLNTAVVSTTFNVLADNQDPTFDAQPQPLNDISCGDVFPPQENLTATDNCGTATVVPTQNFTVDECNGYLVTYTWTATDDCNNTTVVSTTFNVLPDNQDPTFNAQPQPLNDISCGDSFPVQETLTASDNCGTATIVPTQTFTVDECNGYLVTYTWAATDDCNNTTVVSTTFNVLPDNQAPAFDAQPLPVNDISCGDPFPIQETLTATDNCGSVTVVPSQSFVEDLCNGYQVTYTWIATDECMNSTPVSISFNVLADGQAPIFDSAPAVISNINCDDSFPAQETLTATDNCGTAVISTDISFVEDLCNGYTVTYSWTATDDCNNSNTVTQSFEVLPDNSAPTFNRPIDVTIDCDQDALDLTLTGDATNLIDNCGATPTIDFTDDNSGLNGCSGTGTILRNWVATDNCMNTSLVAVQTITVQDTVAPIVTCQDITLNIDATGTVTLNPADLNDGSTDNCSTNLNFSASQTIFDCTHVGNNSITVTVEDDCGNSSTCQANVFVRDNVIPIISCSNDTVIMVSGNATSIMVEDLAPTAGDQCSGFSVTYASTGASILNGTDDVSGSSFDLGTTTVTYTITDVSGNTVDCSFDVTINGAVTIACPNDTTVNAVAGSCAATVSDIPVQVLSGLSLVDSIYYELTGATTDTGTPDASGTTFNVGETTVSYTVEDDMNNQIVCSFIVTVLDNEMPTIDCPSDTVVITSPGDDNIVVNGIDPIASDLCGTTSTTFVLTGATTGSGNGSAAGTAFELGSTTVTYTANDGNGNSMDCSFTVTVNSGGSLFLIDCPADTTLGTASDACGETVFDIDPILLIPTGDVASLTYEITGTTIASGSDDASGTFFNNGVSIVKYKISSIQGVMDSCSFTVTVNDDDDPTASCVPLDAFTADPGACSKVVNNNLLPTTADNCGVDEITYVITGATNASGTGSATGTAFNVGISILTYTVTDAAGNSTSCFSEVQVNDDEAPSGLTCPNDTFILVNQGVTQVTVNDIDINGFSDNCGLDSVAYILSNATTGNGENDASGTIFNLGSTTVTYEVYDINNNLAVCSFVVTVGDTNDGIMCPAAIDINSEFGNCGATSMTLTPIILLDSMFLDSVTYSINGATIASGNGDASGNFFNVGSSTLTYYLYANGGILSDSCQTSIVINDDQNPVWTNCPGDITLVADENCEAVANWIPPVASDNCFIDQINSPTNSSGDLFPIGTTTITYTAIDAAGNMESCSFDIIVEDKSGPEITGPADLTISANSGECFGNASWQLPVATDACSGIQSLTSDLTTADDFPVGNTMVTYTAIDTEGNFSTYSFTVTVEDDEFPVIQNCPPTDLVITPVGNCQVMATWTEPTASDNCGITSFTSSISSGAIISQNTTVIYLAVDESGNVEQCQFDISIMDQIPPTWVTVPSDITLSTNAGNCAAIHTWIEPVATDDCGNVNITASEINGSSFPLGVTTVNLTGTDNGGNVIMDSFTITVEDQEAPAVNCPAAITVREDGRILSDPSNIINDVTALNNCSGVVIELININADDNCDGPITGIPTGGPDLTQGLTAGTYTVNFDFTDAAGNTSSCPLTITVTTLPLISVSAMPNDSACAGENIQIGPADLIQGTIISWTGPNNFFSSVIAPSIEMSAATAGTYTISFSSDNGCISSSSIELFLNEVPDISATSNSPVCNGDVELMGITNSGPAIANWEWSGPCNYSASDQNVTITDLDPNCSGSYTLTATTAEGCSASVTTDIDFTELPLPSLSNDCGSIICLRESCLLIGTEFIQGDINYIWSGAEAIGFQGNTNNNEVEIIPTEVGSFEITYEVEVDGCISNPVTITIDVQGGPEGEDDFYIVPYETVYEGNSVLANDTFFSSFTLEIVNQTDFGTLDFNDDGTFTYTPFDGFIGIDGFEYELCQDCGASECERISAIIRVEFDGDCEVPTFMSPNNDGKNDLLQILCLQSGNFPENRLRISNEWGDVVFEAAPYNNEWDGTLNGSAGKDLPDGTYFYLFQRDLNTEPERGFITILR